MVEQTGDGARVVPGKPRFDERVSGTVALPDRLVSQEVPQKWRPCGV
jgi:hypothetical protein